MFQIFYFYQCVNAFLSVNFDACQSVWTALQVDLSPWHSANQCLIILRREDSDNSLKREGVCAKRENEIFQIEVGGCSHLQKTL